MNTWQLRDPRMAEAIQEACEYFGPEAEHWPDDEVVHPEFYILHAGTNCAFSKV